MSASAPKNPMNDEFVAATPRTGAGSDIDIALRQAVALEYIAFHIGKIDNKLDRLIAASERVGVAIAKRG